MLRDDPRLNESHFFRAAEVTGRAAARAPVEEGNPPACYAGAPRQIKACPVADPMHRIIPLVPQAMEDSLHETRLVKNHGNE